jgi:hypothetical protein
MKSFPGVAAGAGETNAKASPLVCVLPALMQDKNFELRTQSYVSRLIYDKQAKKVRGVVYIDRRTGEEVEQPADMVVLCAYAFNNTQLLLAAGIGEPYDPVTGRGVVGKNYCHQTTSGVLMFVDDEVNPFIGTGTSPAAIGRLRCPRRQWSGPCLPLLPRQRARGTECSRKTRRDGSRRTWRGSPSCSAGAGSRKARTGTATYFGFHSRASFCASAICAGVNCAATISQAFTAFLFLLAAAKLNHMCATV